MADLTTPFEGTFDFNFQNLFPPTAIITIDACRMPGILLHWLTLRGWCTYLFGGNTDTDFAVESHGSYAQAGGQLDSYRSGGDQQLVRQGNLTQKQSDILKSVLLSPAVFALIPGVDNKVKLARVYIESGKYPVWRDSLKRMNIEFTIIYPTVNSQRT